MTKRTYRMIEWLFLATLGILLALSLVGCGETPAPRGSAQDQAAGAQARAETTRQAADAATVDAAKTKADADAARRRSQEADAAAVAKPTPELIEAAAKARVDAARAEERAAASQAVALALEQVAVKADREATAKATDARKERDAEAAAADLRHWVNLCRWLGLAGVAGGALLGGLLWWFAGPHLAVPVGALLSGTGLLVVAFGATVTWLPLVLGAAVVVGVVAWALSHQRTLRLGLELSRTVDALEGKALGTVTEAKEELGKALDRSGLRRRFESVRGTWKRAESTAHAIAVKPEGA